MAEVTARTINRWIRDEGLPLIRAGAKGAGRGAVIDGVEFVRWLVARIATPAGSLDLEQERARLAKWQADKAEQDVELRARRMLDAADVQGWVADMISVVRQRFLQIPEAVGQLVPRDVAELVIAGNRRLIHEALAELSERGKSKPRQAGPPQPRGNGAGRATAGCA